MKKMFLMSTALFMSIAVLSGCSWFEGKKSAPLQMEKTAQTENVGVEVEVSDKAEVKADESVGVNVQVK